MTANISFETLCAFHDDELPQGEAENIRKKIETDQSLAAQFFEIEKADQAATEMFSELLDEPIPLSVLRSLKSAEHVSEQGPVRFAISPWRTAIAASFITALICGVAGYLAFDHQITRMQTAFENTRDQDYSLLTSAFQNALEKQVSGKALEIKSTQGNFSVKVSPILTYKSKSGHWCREFAEVVRFGTLEEERKGLACRKANGTWHRISTEVQQTRQTPL